MRILLAEDDELLGSGLRAGLAQDLDPLANFLIRLRVVHPILAILVGVGVILLANYSLQRTSTAEVRRAVHTLRALVVVQWVAGFVNVVLLAPVWMQLVHLLVADLLWITLVLLAATTLAEQQAPSESGLESEFLVPSPSGRGLG